jgi:hypothetical protein
MMMKRCRALIWDPTRTELYLSYRYNEHRCPFLNPQTDAEFTQNLVTGQNNTSWIILCDIEWRKVGLRKRV